MVIFEKVQSIHQTESPQKRCMNGAKQMIGSKAMARHYFSVINTKWLKFVHLYRLDGMPAIERRKKGAVGFLTRASHKTGSASITQQCFIILGRGPCLIYLYFIPGGRQIRYHAFEKYKVQSRQNTQNAAARHSSRLTADVALDSLPNFWLNFPLQNVRTGPAQKIDTHTLIHPIFWHPIPNWQICFVFLISLKHIYQTL